MPYKVHACPIRTGATAGKVIDQATFDRLLDLYYQKRGWDADGIPPAEVAEQFARRQGCETYSHRRGAAMRWREHRTPAVPSLNSVCESCVFPRVEIRPRSACHGRCVRWAPARRKTSSCRRCNAPARRFH